MEGKVYYRIKTPNGFLDTHYETIEETQKNLDEYKKEEGKVETLCMTRVIEFEEELYSDDFIGDNYNTPYIQPANIAQEDYDEEKANCEKIIDDSYNEKQTWQADYGDLAFYTLYLENRTLWDIIKSKIMGDNIPSEYKNIDLGFYRKR